MRKNKKIGALLAAVLSFAFAARGQAERGKVVKAMNFTVDKIRNIQVRTGSGDIRVDQANGEFVKVDAIDPASGSGKCALTMEIQGVDLVVKAQSPKTAFFRFWKSRGCKIGFDIKAPGGLAVDAASGSGNVKVSSRQADVDIKTGSGDIEVRGLTGKLSAKAGSGSIQGESLSDIRVFAGSGSVRLDRLTASARVQTGSGDIDIEWIKVPEKGMVKVASGSGDVILSFPAGSKLSSRVRSLTGKVANDWGNLEGASFVVAATVGSGNVAIKKLPAPNR